jgi:phosphoglycerol transferase MdoB-like AlkP superfamily enzyme
LLHLDFMSAASFNRLSFIVLPLLILLWFQEMRRSILRIKELSKKQKTKEAS